MKINTLLALLFCSVIIYAGIEYSNGITGTTNKNGDGCVCHNLTPTPTVWVRIEGPDTLLQGQTAQYIIKLSGGPAVKGGFNVASYLGNLTAGPGVQKIGSELTHSTAANFSDSVLSWSFSFTAQNNNYTDTLYSVANSVNGNGSPSGDQWNHGAKFPVVVLDVIPVELTSFLAEQSTNGILLKWTTASEINNSGFVIERLSSDLWVNIGFVSGNGTTTSSNQYSFIDKSPLSGVSYYRLKQMDFDGSFTYSNEIEITFNGVVSDFLLEQNFPNPFNPTTKISWQSAAGSHQTLKVFDVLGNEVAVLVDEFREAGNHRITFNASGLASGIYYYTLKAGDLSQTKKMVLIQ